MASEFSDVNFATIAGAMGCRGHRIEQPGDLEKALKEAVESDVTTVLDVVTSREFTYRDVSFKF